MGFIQSSILGMVQGLGEFLPISSSGHLIITSWLLQWQDQGLAFDVALHWGTLIAVLIYFRAELVQLALSFFTSLVPAKRNLKTDANQRLAWLIILATIPAAISGMLLEHYVETVLRSPLVVVVTLTAGGALLLIFDRLGKKVKELGQMSWKDALVIGVAQAFSVIPGVSRSGSTMTAALGMGLKREQAARFSFLMSAPVILGAGLMELPEIFREENIAGIAIGFISAAFFGIIAIHFLLKYVSTRSFAIFAWYRIGLAALILVVYLIRQ